MKKHADQKRLQRFFNVGDQVYLKIQPYVQSSVSTRSNPKLAFKYFGPYTVIQQIGSVAYKLQLPETASIHTVFHVSQLKAVMGRNQEIVPTLPNAKILLQVPLQILARRLI